jgi:hypothetical protein
MGTLYFNDKPIKMEAPAAYIPGLLLCPRESGDERATSIMS